MSATARYFIQYSIFIACIAGGLFAWNKFAPVNYQHSLAWALFGFFTLAYALGHLYMQGASGQRAAVFVRRFMATTTIRLLVFLLVLVIYIFSNKVQAVPFICHFLAFYLTYTVFEVAALSRHFRKND